MAGIVKKREPRARRFFGGERPVSGAKIMSRGKVGTNFNAKPPRHSAGSRNRRNSTADYADCADGRKRERRILNRRKRR